MVVAIDHTRGNQVSPRWLLYDGHGNLVRMMSPDYTLSAFQWRGVWGEVQGSLGAGKGYCANLGHPEDETGLVYMHARYYEPATGRFISEDPARDGVNWYLYADGNPVAKVDDTGKAAIDATQIFFFLGTLFGGLAASSLALGAFADYNKRYSSSGNDPFEEWFVNVSIGFTHLFAVMSVICFGVALNGRVPGGLAGWFTLFTTIAPLLVATLDVISAAAGRPGFMGAGVAVGAAFIYMLMVSAALYINEIDEVTQ